MCACALSRKCLKEVSSLGCVVCVCQRLVLRTGGCRLSLVVKVYPPNKQRSLAAGNHLKSIILTYRSDNNEVKTIKEAWVDQ